MNEFKTITANSSAVKISSCLEKIYKNIHESYIKQVPESSLKEIEFLKLQCKSDNVHVSLMSTQVLVRLVENSMLDSQKALAMMISMLPNSSFTQYNNISEAIVSLLLLGLKNKIVSLTQNEKFHCQFGLKTQQHPMITLLQSPTVNMYDIGNKVNRICHHLDPQIRNNSVEYLRPFFLYILCNPQIISDCKIIWSGLLELSETNVEAEAVVKEVLCWSRFSTSATCIFTSVILIEAIDHNLNHKNLLQVAQLCIFESLIINSLVAFGINPKPSLQNLMRSLQMSSNYTIDHYNVLILLLSQSMHLMSPANLPDLFRILAFIIVQENCGHRYILNMCLDGIIQWMSQTAFIPKEGLDIAHQIIKKILANECITSMKKININNLPTTHVRYLHPDIAIAIDLAKLVESFDESEFKNIFGFVDALNIKSNPNFCQRMHLFLRSLFLSSDTSIDCWFKIYEVILELITINHGIAYDFLMAYIFKLANEQNPEIQIELLRGLPNFGVSKDNIPIILNTVRNLGTINHTFCIDLYFRLWRVENRTYPFLINLLAQPPKDNVSQWEYNLAKSYTIREICFERPSSYGSELVSHLSNLLNACTEENDDLTTSFAIDAIIALCESNTINVISTYRVLNGKFRKERRIRSLKSIFNFYAKVPNFSTLTLEYQQLVDEALGELWSAVTNPNSTSELIKAALEALKSYEIGIGLTLRHIPHLFRQGLESVQECIVSNGREILDLETDSVPGECWVQLLQKIRPDCGSAAADLIAHHIFAEINEYRSGVYRLATSKPEPRRLQGLFKNSPLRAIVNYLVSQSHLGDHISEPHVITFALRSICKKFPKPIPPVDWCFLHSFFHLSFEARKYCILIAKNQIQHSGTACRLLENFLVEFEPNCFEEDLLLLFSLLPEISNVVDLVILKEFLEKVVLYCFRESQLNGFAEGCLFEKFLESVKHIFTRKCDIPKVVDIYTLIVERYMDSMDLNSKVFERYTEVVAVLNETSIEGLTSPVNWWETPVGKLKKATVIRCYLVLYNTQLPNPLKWLTPIVDAYATLPEERPFFYQHLVATLYSFKNNECTCLWIMEMFLQIQTLLADQSRKENFKKVLYLLDILILSVVVLSGCAVLLGTIDIVVTQQHERMAMFPESLQLLCNHTFWKDQEAKIYEILYNLYKNSAIPNLYAEIFKNAIICSRNKSYFENKTAWTKYVGMRK